MFKTLMHVALTLLIFFTSNCGPSRAQSKDNGRSTMLTEMPNLPSIAPYPGAKMEKGWRTMDGAESVNLILLTADSKTKVFDWYHAALTASGWKLNTSDEKSFRLSGRNSRHEFITVNVSEGAAKSSRITLIYIKV
ncbi:MAG: hypothetical protein JST89_00185 [Cyanobacteria bacterium SZAS-4]|nr:hypothetical protein [Cyanobacteria bacterium SZAS-4]